jgi:hypothetical protein
MDYFYSAAKHRFRNVLWSNFALALILSSGPKISATTRINSRDAAKNLLRETANSLRAVFKILRAVAKGDGDEMRLEVDLELQVHADFDSAATIIFAEAFTKGRILRSSVPNIPSRMIEGVEEFPLHVELNLLIDRNRLGDRNIGIRSKTVVAPEPVARTHGARGAVWA